MTTEIEKVLWGTEDYPNLGIHGKDNRARVSGLDIGANVWTQAIALIFRSDVVDGTTYTGIIGVYPYAVTARARATRYSGSSSNTPKDARSKVIRRKRWTELCDQANGAGPDVGRETAAPQKTEEQEHFGLRLTYIENCLGVLLPQLT